MGDKSDGVRPLFDLSPSNEGIPSVESFDYDPETESFTLEGTIPAGASISVTVEEAGD